MKEREKEGERKGEKKEGERKREKNEGKRKCRQRIKRFVKRRDTGLMR